MYAFVPLNWVSNYVIIFILDAVQVMAIVGAVAATLLQANNNIILGVNNSRGVNRW